MLFTDIMLCSVKISYSTLLFNVVADIYSDISRTSEKAGWMNSSAFYEANLWNCKVALKYIIGLRDVTCVSTQQAVQFQEWFMSVTKASGKLHAEFTDFLN